MPGYWNRDLTPSEPFKAWHTECFHESVGRTPTWQKLAREGQTTRAQFIVGMFGGPDHLRELLANDSHYADRIREWNRRAREPMTPDGYAWAPWAISDSQPCEHCGEIVH